MQLNIKTSPDGTLTVNNTAAGTAFAKGEYGWWQDKLYESLLDSNVWTPEQNSQGWKVIDN